MKAAMTIIAFYCICFGEFLETDSILGNDGMVQLNDTTRLNTTPPSTAPDSLPVFDSLSKVMRAISVWKLPFAIHSDTARYADTAGYAFFALLADSSIVAWFADTAYSAYKATRLGDSSFIDSGDGGYGYLFSVNDSSRICPRVSGAGSAIFEIGDHITQSGPTIHMDWTGTTIIRSAYGASLYLNTPGAFVDLDSTKISGTSDNFIIKASLDNGQKLVNSKIKEQDDTTTIGFGNYSGLRLNGATGSLAYLGNQLEVWSIEPTSNGIHYYSTDNESHYTQKGHFFYSRKDSSGARTDTLVFAISGGGGASLYGGDLNVYEGDVNVDAGELHVTGGDTSWILNSAFGIGIAIPTARVDVRSLASAGSETEPTLRAFAYDIDSYFEVTNNANNSANLILTRSNSDTMLNVNGHTGDLSLFRNAYITGYVTKQVIGAGFHHHDDTITVSVASGAAYQQLDVFPVFYFENEAIADTANGKLILNHNGVYIISGTISQFPGTGNLVWKPAIFVNDLERDEIHGEEKMQNASDKTTLPISGTLIISDAPDTVDYRVRHNGGGSANIYVTYANLSATYQGYLP